MRSRSKALWAVAALLAVNAVLLAAQPGFALPGSLPQSLGSYFFGPKLVRAELLIKDADGLHDFRVDRGVLRARGGGELTLRERDGTVVTIAVDGATAVTLRGRPASLGALRKGMTITAVRDGDRPATEIRAGG
jgi:hypothetical protein